MFFVGSETLLTVELCDWRSWKRLKNIWSKKTKGNELEDQRPANYLRVNEVLGVQDFRGSVISEENKIQDRKQEKLFSLEIVIRQWSTLRGPMNKVYVKSWV